MVTSNDCPSTAGTPSSITKGALTFDNATDALGLVEPLTGMMGHAVAVADVNGDGRADLFVGGFADRPAETYAVRGALEPSPDRLLLGGPDGFTIAAGFEGTNGRTSSAAFADLNNDGRPDLVVVRNRNLKNVDTDRAVINSEPTKIYRNDGEGRFTDVGSAGPEQLGRAVTALDADGDGLLDLFIGQDGPKGSAALLHNDGNFRFTDVTTKSGLPTPLVAYGASAADLNGDGHLDLVLAGSNKLFAGDGKGSFRDVTPDSFAWSTHGDEDIVTGVAVGDLDGDGRADLVFGHHFSSALTGEPVPVRVFLNRGNGDGAAPAWEDVTEASGVPGFPTKAPHVEVADFDNDGLPDVLVTASAADGQFPVVLRNEGVKSGTHAPRFTAPERPGDPQYWVTGAVFDADQDGRLDIFVAEWCTQKPSLLLRNTTSAGHWLDIDLGATPLGGIGASVQIFRAGAAGQPDALLGSGWATASTGYGAGATPIVHVGLADVTKVDVVIRQADGRVTTLRDVASDQTLHPGPAG